MAVTAGIVNNVVNLVEEPVCKCRIEIISYQLDQLASDLFFCLRISNLFTSGIVSCHWYHYGDEFTKVWDHYLLDKIQFFEEKDIHSSVA